MSVSRTIKVVAPAHLHVGNFDLTGDLGRLFGTVGFAIDIPIEVEVMESGSPGANETWADRFAKLFSNYFGVNVSAHVNTEVPPLSGMGYVTTVALAIGLAASRIAGAKVSLEQIAAIAKRGTLTALGFYAFKYGGFIVEGGFRPEELDRSVPPLIFRGEVPGSWRFVIALPRAPLEALTRMREGSEEGILKNIKRAPPQLSDSLSRLVLMKIIPSFVEGDLRGLVEGISAMNSRLGDFWGAYQGSRYCCELVERGINLMASKAGGGCQSSWGPAFYTIVEGEEAATELARELELLLKESGGGRVFVVRANNRGAVIYG